MKKTTFVALSATVALGLMSFIPPATPANNTFEGVITYSVSVDNPQLANVAASSSVITYIKGGKTKTYFDMGVSKSTFYTNSATPDANVVLIQAMGNNYQLKKDDKKSDVIDPEIKYLDGTKIIAGHTCHKAQMTLKGGDGKPYTTDVYYTEDIPATPDVQSPFNQLKGFPLEYTKRQQGMNLLITATTIEKKNLPDDTFTIPTGYKVMTAKEITQDVQKQMADTQ